MLNPISQSLKFVIKLPIYIYRYAISPLLGPKCRFLPTCSEYAIDSIEKHGVFYGVFLAIKRILKCHPWNNGGIDEVK